MNPAVQQAASYLAVLFLGGGSGAAVLVAWINRKPKPAVLAEAFAANAAGHASIASAFGALVNDLQEEISRKEGELVTMRTDLHKLRNRLSALDGFARKLMNHLDVQDRLIVQLGGTPPPRPTIPEPGP